MSKFKTIVRQAVVDSALLYKKTFVDYEYLVCSPAFKDKPYYIIDAHEDNFEHLTGVTSSISPQEFFNRCINNTLTEKDFDFTKSGQSVGEVKNFVKMKISILPLLDTIFNTSTWVEEHFFQRKSSLFFRNINYRPYVRIFNKQHCKTEITAER